MTRKFDTWIAAWAFGNYTGLPFSIERIAEHGTTRHVVSLHNI